jgi:SAM-dependent methyltransferase
MSGFSAEWLARREPYDRRARNRDVLSAVAERFASYPSLTVVDLACGTGATLRAVSAALPHRQSWRLVDNDLSLLARVQQTAGAAIALRAIPVDLAHDLEAALDGPVDLVTTSAFLDLASAEWIERLVTEVAARNRPFYAALSYDGHVALTPRDALDAAILAAFNRHQVTDKGFGPALGPAAAAEAIARFERIGYAVAKGASDWVLGPTDDLQTEILAGFAGAAAEAGVASGEIAEWMDRRTSLLAAQHASLQVGHLDFFAYPSGRR